MVFQKNSFSFLMKSSTNRLQFRQPYKKISTGRPKLIRAMSWKDRNFDFWSENSSWQCSFRLADCSFNKHAEQNSTKGENLSAQCAKVVWRRCFFKRKLLKKFPQTLEMQLEQHCRTYSFEKAGIFSLSVRQRLKNNFFSKKLNNHEKHSMDW